MNRIETINKVSQKIDFHIKEYRVNSKKAKFCSQCYIYCENNLKTINILKDFANEFLNIYIYIDCHVANFNRRLYKINGYKIYDMQNPVDKKLAEKEKTKNMW